MSWSSFSSPGSSVRCTKVHQAVKAEQDKADPDTYMSLCISQQVSKSQFVIFKTIFLTGLEVRCNIFITWIFMYCHYQHPKETQILDINRLYTVNTPFVHYRILSKNIILVSYT